MTTSEESIAPAPPAPKYRYFTTPPDVLQLKAEDLTAFLPEGAWEGSGADKQRAVSVPAAGILETNYPRIRFTQLRDLLPGCIGQIADAPEWVALPADRVALAYKIETRRELIPEPAIEKPPLEAPNPPPAEEPTAGSVPAWKRLPKPVLAPIPEPTPIAETKPEILAGPPKPPRSFGESLVPSEAALKEIFAADISLSVQQLVDWCGRQPGVKACLLTRGTDAVKSGETLEQLQVARVNSEIFSAVKKIAAVSELKLRQALTIHTDSGPISFVRHRGMVLAVFHSTGSLTSEMRAKYKSILQAIERATAPQP